MGWYRYYTKFALPVFDDDGEIERYNAFNVVVVVRHNQDGKLYLYDIMNIKKKRAPFSSPKTLLSKKPVSFRDIIIGMGKSQDKLDLEML